MASTKSIIRRFDEVSIPLPALVRLFLGGLFIHAGVNKVLDPVAFLKAVRLYHMLPETPPYFLNATAVVVPWVEVVCGVALILGLWRRGAAAMLALMLCVFTPAIFLRAMVVHGTEGTPFFQIEFDCGCGTGSDIIWLKLLSNAGLLLLAILALISRSRRFSLAMLLDRKRPAPAHCRRCGEPVQAGGDGLCGSCRELLQRRRIAAPDTVT